MNCQECQRQLLTGDDPASQTLEVAAHLAECRACQDWHQRLVRIESNVPLLPVPPSNAGERLQRLFLETTPAMPEIVTVPRRTSKSQWRPALTVVTGMAAAILLTALGVLLGNMLSRGIHNKEPLAKNQIQDEKPQLNPELKKGPTKPLAAMILDCDLRLAQTSDRSERSEILADLADVLHVESKNLTQAGANREFLAIAKLYDQVLQNGVPAGTRGLPPDLRQANLNPITKNPVQIQMAALKIAEFQRDEPMIEKFVAGALVLAVENDPLQRARQCNILAGLLTKEIQLAAKKQETPRAAELGRMLQDVLADGIADNLSLARSDVLPETPRALEVAQLGQNIVNAAKPLEETIEQLPPQDQPSMNEVLRAVNKAVDDVHIRSQGKGPKVVPKGKKAKK